MEITYIFIFITAVVFTFVGYGMGKANATLEIVNIAIATTIDSLIKEGYLKTRGSGKDIEIVKLTDDQAD